METKLVVLLIILIALSGALPRLLPILAFGSRTFPNKVNQWLSFVPTAVIAAMLVPPLIASKGTIDLTFSNLHFWAAIPTFAVAMKTRSLFATIVTGLTIVAAIRFFF